MYKYEFDKLLKEEKRFDAYMFYGQSAFLIEYYSKLVCEHITQEEIQKIYFDDYNFKYVKNQLLQASLFSSKNLIVLKIAKKLVKKEVEALIHACNINPSSTIIFSCLGDAEFKTMGSYFSNKTNSISVRMFEPRVNEAMNILEIEAKKIGILYDVSALNHLYFMHRQDLSLCINDLNKLYILKEKLTKSLINRHCFSMGNISFEDFLHDLIMGNDIYEDLKTFLEEGINEIYLLGQITYFVQQLFMISAYTRSFGAPNPKEILGFIPPKNVWDKKTKLAISIKPEKFQKIFETLMNLELDLKSPKIDNQSLFLQASLRKITAMLR